MFISHNTLILSGLITLVLADAATTWHMIPFLVASKSTGNSAADADKIFSHRRFLVLMLLPYTIATCLAGKLFLQISSLTPVAIIAVILVADMALGIQTLRRRPVSAQVSK